MDEHLTTAGDRHEIVLVPKPVPPANPFEAIRHLAADTFAIAQSSAAFAASLAGRVVGPPVAATTNAVLDAVVPRVAEAIIGRIPLTDVVLDNVDLTRVVDRALDGMDLTDVVISRVDLDAVVAAVDMDQVIDRVPVIPLANYVIEEIDLPQIIRSSTGGIATDAMTAVRVQGVGADELLARVADRVLLRRRKRKLDAPGDPDSLRVPPVEPDAS